MGEAMHSLVCSSQVVILTREKGQKQGYKLTYSYETAELTHKTKVQVPFGTTIEVRKIHMRNPRGCTMFKKFVRH